VAVHARLPDLAHRARRAGHRDSLGHVLVEEQLLPELRERVVLVEQVVRVAGRLARRRIGLERLECLDLRPLLVREFVFLGAARDRGTERENRDGDFELHD
jgi:hypothetical protein